MRFHQCSIAAVAVLILGAPARAEDVSFLRDVAPILMQRCIGCHGPTKVEGDYRLHTFEFLMKEGATGETPVKAREADASEIVRRITDSDEATRMPQLDDPLSAKEIDLIRNWISQGAKFDGADPAASIKGQMPPRKPVAAPEKYRVSVPIFALSFSPDGKQLAAGGHNEVTIWDASTGELLKRVPGAPQRVQSLEWLDETTLVVAGGTPGEYGEVSLLGVETPEARLVLGTFEDLVLAAAVNHAKTHVAAASADRNVRSFELTSGKLTWESRLHSDWATCIDFSYDDRYVATGGRDFNVKVLDAANGHLFCSYNGHQRNLGQEQGRFAVFALAFSDDGSRAFSAGEGKSIRVWEPEKAKTEDGSAAQMEIRFFKEGHTKFLMHGASQPVFKLVPSGPHVFAATGNGDVRQFDIESQKLVRSYQGGDWMFSADAHAATSRLAAGGYNGEIRIWDTQSGELVSSFIAAPGASRAN